MLLLAWDVPNFFVLRDKEAILPKPRLMQRVPDEGEDIILDVVTTTKETPVNVKVVVGKVAYATAARHERKPPPKNGSSLRVRGTADSRCCCGPTLIR